MFLYSLGFDSLGLHVLLWDGIALFVLRGTRKGCFTGLDLLSLVLLVWWVVFCLRCLGRSISVEMGLVINYMSSSIGWALGALGKWILYLTQYIIPVRHYIPLRMLNQVKYTF